MRNKSIHVSALLFLMALCVLAYDMAEYSNYEKRALHEIERINAFRDRSEMEYDSILKNHHAEIERILKQSLED